MIFMGTATAIVYVDASNAYHGGAIAPGMGISLDAPHKSRRIAFIG